MLTDADVHKLNSVGYKDNGEERFSSPGGWKAVPIGCPAHIERRIAEARYQRLAAYVDRTAPRTAPQRPVHVPYRGLPDAEYRRCLQLVIARIDLAVERERKDADLRHRMRCAAGIYSDC